MFFFKNKPDFILVGLGNPGIKYKFTRHNVGFMILDYIASKCGVSLSKTKFNSLFSITHINNKSVLLMEPNTFMNLSGTAVSQAMNFYKIKPENVIVILDDINLSPGKMRIRRSGSDGGHNGMKNIITCAKSQNFIRIKVGIGERNNSSIDLADWVLSKFSSEEIKKINCIAEDIYDSISLILDGKIDVAMNKYNS